jgi:hypothetical protein
MHRAMPADAAQSVPGANHNQIPVMSTDVRCWMLMLVPIPVHAQTTDHDRIDSIFLSALYPGQLRQILRPANVSLHELAPLLGYQASLPFTFPFSVPLCLQFPRFTPDPTYILRNLGQLSPQQ